MSMKKMNERKRTFLLMTIPVVALFFCFNTLPLLKGVMYSFTNFKGFGSYDWVGVRNYMDLFQDVRVGNSYWFTFKLAIVTTIVVNVISLLLAMALNSKIRAKSFFRGAYFLPNILGALVVGYIFNYFFTYILPAVGEMIGWETLSSSLLSSVVVKHFCNTLFENSPGISSFKWCFPIIVGMRTDMIVPYVHISV